MTDPPDAFAKGIERLAGIKVEHERQHRVVGTLLGPGCKWCWLIEEMEKAREAVEKMVHARSYLTETCDGGWVVTDAKTIADDLDAALKMWETGK